jgi:hypothetical protein
MRIVTVAFACLELLLLPIFDQSIVFFHHNQAKNYKDLNKISTRFPEEIKRVKCLNFHVKL